MKTLRQFWQQTMVRRLAAVCLAGMLMLAGTACSTTQASAPEVSNPSTGGQDMYPYEDTTRDTTAADKKAKAAIDQAEARRRSVLGADDSVEAVEPGEKLTQQAKDFGSAVKQSAQDAVEDTREDFESIPENLEDAADQAAKQAEKTT